MEVVGEDVPVEAEGRRREAREQRRARTGSRRNSSASARMLSGHVAVNMTVRRAAGV